MDMDYKQVKDPIYGYIRISSDYVNNIIDTNVFQRLRRITQTSYSPLYPSAVHNRFIHSFGVFYLGSIASDALIKAINENSNIKYDINWNNISRIFKLACLLHDVGHAPFSHTGENFFLNDADELNYSDSRRYAGLHDTLAECVNSESFKKDIPTEESQAAAPHEIMSAILGIKEFNNQFNNTFDKELFARCITGYQFSEDYEEKSIYNCFISLLNSKVIDVDRMDYLIRDAYFTGFETVNIDYLRLLNSIIIVENDIDLGKNIVKTQFKIGYNKNAISIIENVVYAHDSERKWIQTHPIVLYDMYIIQHIMDSINKEMQKNSVPFFSINALTSEGIKLSKNKHLSLLCDDDIVHLLKQKKDDELRATSIKQ